MNILLIGEADTIWVKSVIEKTHLPFGDNVSILTGKNTIFKDYYENNHIRILRLKKIRSPFGFFNLCHNLKIVFQHYDLVIIHFIGGHRVLLARIARFFSDKLILVFWGSDLLRKKKNWIVNAALKASSSVLIGTQPMNDVFVRYYGHQYDNKIRKINFGSRGMDSLKKIENNQSGLRAKYNIDESKIVISIGYNKMMAQQHLKVLDMINALSDEQRSKIHLLFRLTYGDGDAEYINKIRRLVAKSGCSNSFFESYLSDDEVAELTLLTDIFIHAQITDAKSASMCEHLYAGALVINPDWIKYPDLENRVFYLTFNEFDELRRLIGENLVKKDSSRYCQKLVSNRQIIYDICSWDAHVKKWRDMYLN